MEYIPVIVKNNTANINGYGSFEYQNLQSFQQLIIKQQVKQLNIVHCKAFKNLEGIEQCGSELQKIVINETSLDAIAVFARRSTPFQFTLQVLNLEQNQLQSLNGVETLQNLSYLNVKSNHIKMIEPLSKLKKLHEINISDNEIDDDEQLQYLIDMPYMTSLILYGNSMTSKVDFLKKLAYALSTNVKFLNYNKTISDKSFQLENEMDQHLYLSIVNKNINPFKYDIEIQQYELEKTVTEQKSRDNRNNALILQLNDKVDNMQLECYRKLDDLTQRLERVEKKVDYCLNFIKMMNNE